MLPFSLYGKVTVIQQETDENGKTMTGVIWRNTMNTRKSLYDIKSFYNKKAVLKASFQGMRYQLEQYRDPENEEAEPVLRTTIWPEPFCFEKTDPDKKTIRDFVYTEEGLDEAYDWLCQIYEERSGNGARQEIIHIRVCFRGCSEGFSGNVRENPSDRNRTSQHGG